MPVREEETEMANKYMKIWKISLLSSKIKIKAVKHHFSLLWWGCRKMGMWIVATDLESNLPIFKVLKTITSDPEIPLWGISPTEIRAHVLKLINML